MKISIVSPVYLGESSVNELVERCFNAVQQTGAEVEIILVEDRGPDASWEKIEALCRQDPRVKGIRMSRNFGQHYAITAGLAKAQGDWIVVMDCDLQDRPEEIPRLFAATKEGYDIVFARRKSRRDGILKRSSSSLFYGLFGYLTNSRQDAAIANFGIYHRKVVQAVLAMKDNVRYFPTMVQWVGFNSTKVDVEHGERPGGGSSYSVGKLFRLAFDNIISFSDKPLRLTVQLGLMISLVSFLIGLYYIYKYLNGEIVVLGFTSIVLSIWFLSGLIIFILGIIGIYLGKTFDRVKDRPVYIIEKEINL